MKRGKLDIINDMLRAIERKGGRILPTHLMYKSNLSHGRMKLYVDELLARGLIEETRYKDKVFYALTDHGRKFVQKFQQVKAFTEAFGL